MLGQVSHLKHGTGTTGLVKATKRLLRKFCRQFSGSPPGPSGQRAVPGPLDMVLFRNVTQTTELFDADAAKDENVALRQMGQPANQDDVAAALFPNLRLVVKDKTHASKRCITLPILLPDLTVV